MIKDRRAGVPPNPLSPPFSLLILVSGNTNHMNHFIMSMGRLTYLGS